MGLEWKPDLASNLDTIDMLMFDTKWFSSIFSILRNNSCTHIIYIYIHMYRNVNVCVCADNADGIYVY